MKSALNVAENSGARLRAPTVREGLAASTRLIRQRPRSPLWLRLVCVRVAREDSLRIVNLAACWRSSSKEDDDSDASVYTSYVFNARLVFSESSFLGVDYDCGSIASAMKLAAEKGVSNVEFIQAPADQIPTEERQADHLVLLRSEVAARPHSARDIDLTCRGPLAAWRLYDNSIYQVVGRQEMSDTVFAVTAGIRSAHRGRVWSKQHRPGLNFIEHRVDETMPRRVRMEARPDIFRRS